jgi:DNA-binding transcriptional MerR regulator
MTEKPIKKLYYKISEVSAAIGVSQPALRYWMERFKIESGRNKRGHRLFTDKELIKIQYIKFLAYHKKFTFEGVEDELKRTGWPKEAQLNEMIRDLTIAFKKAA